MSKLRLNQINFNDNEVIVEVDKEEKKAILSKIQQADIDAQKKTEEANNEAKKIIDEATLVLNRAKDEAQEIIDKANLEAQEIKDKINQEFEQIDIKKNEILENTNLEAEKIIEEARINIEKEKNELNEKLREEIEQQRIETIKNAYDEGYKDGLEHIQKELEEKIANFEIFCKNQKEIKEKILKSANKDILDLILTITKKILLKEINAQTIDKIIKNTISLLEKKENITIILSQKYAKLLYELQKEKLADDTELNFENFKQYENFDVVYNPNFDDDTIIIENLKERFDASINTQLDVIIRNIYDNTQNGKLDLETYANEIE